MPAQLAVATNEIRKEAREPRKLRASNSQTEAFAEHEMANPILGECSAEAKPVAPKPQANVNEDAAAAAHHQQEGSNSPVTAIQVVSATTVAPLAEVNLHTSLDTKTNSPKTGQGESAKGKIAKKQPKDTNQRNAK